jgi:transposase
MKAYSLDLRERIVQAAEQGQPLTVVARRFAVGRSTVQRYLTRARRTQQLAPKPIPGRPATIPSEAHWALEEQVHASPDATLAEHCDAWEKTQGIRVSVATMCRALQRINWPRKKRLCGPASRI